MFLHLQNCNMHYNEIRNLWWKFFVYPSVPNKQVYSISIFRFLPELFPLYSISKLSTPLFFKNFTLHVYLGLFVLKNIHPTCLIGTWEYCRAYSDQNKFSFFKIFKNVLYFLFFSIIQIILICVHYICLITYVHLKTSTVRVRKSWLGEMCANFW